jgi:acetolactate synthase-1/2/3 large subunit
MLLHVAIDARANVWPLVPPNNANSTMLDSNPAHAKATQESSNAIPA